MTSTLVEKYLLWGNEGCMLCSRSSSGELGS